MRPKKVKVECIEEMFVSYQDDEDEDFSTFDFVGLILEGEILNGKLYSNRLELNIHDTITIEVGLDDFKNNFRVIQ